LTKKTHKKKKKNKKKKNEAKLRQRKTSEKTLATTEKSPGQGGRESQIPQMCSTLPGKMSLKKNSQRRGGLSETHTKRGCQKRAKRKKKERHNEPKGGDQREKEITNAEDRGLGKKKKRADNKKNPDCILRRDLKNRNCET